MLRSGFTGYNFLIRASPTSNTTNRDFGGRSSLGIDSVVLVIDISRMSGTSNLGEYRLLRQRSHLDVMPGNHNNSAGKWAGRGQ
jgi:hypothetical protein